MKYMLEYRYLDGTNVGYSGEDLTPGERKHIDALIEIWGFDPENTPSEVVLYLSDSDDDGEDINFPAEPPLWK